MRTFQLNKLIRDKVLDSMLELGQRVKYRTLKQGDVLPALKNKLVEEAGEFDPSNPKALDELADVLEVVEQIAQELGSDFRQLRTRQATRRRKRGGFEKRIFVETVTVEETDPWANYYAGEPDRFPEVLSPQPKTKPRKT